VLATIARRIGGTAGQVIFKWAHAKGFVVVTTTSRRTRLHEYLDVVHLRASPSLLSPFSGRNLPPHFFRLFFYSEPHARRNRSDRRGRRERPTSPQPVMATKSFVCSRDAHPCGTRHACHIFCDYALVLSWMARVAMMAQRFLGFDYCCADLAVSSRLYSIFKDAWCRGPWMNEPFRAIPSSLAVNSPSIVPLGLNSESIA
jgi:hypothetical protein